MTLLYEDRVVYWREVEAPAVGEVDLDEAVELFGDSLQSNYSLQWNKRENMRHQHILPRQVQQVASEKDNRQVTK